MLSSRRVRGFFKSNAHNAPLLITILQTSQLICHFYGNSTLEFAPALRALARCLLSARLIPSEVWPSDNLCFQHYPPRWAPLGIYKFRGKNLLTLFWLEEAEWRARLNPVSLTTLVSIIVTQLFLFSARAARMLRAAQQRGLDARGEHFLMWCEL